MRKKSGRPQKVPMTFRLDIETIRIVKELATTNYRTFSDMMNIIIKDLLTRHGINTSGHPLTPTTTLKRMRQSQRLAELEQTAKNLLAAIQAMRDEDAV